ncbi:polysaccharide deacetylase family protein [Actinoplanes sp. NPDC049598]|uniref:polysaccharide deacetylase family protein n=1 Tax=Actinoplanes sp. NPDC049598 TaxID=3154626 RepID=UPI003437655F
MGTILAIAAGCGSPGGSPSAGAPSAAPSVSGASGTPGAVSGASGAPSPSAEPDVRTVALAALPANLRGRIPQFPPAPPAEKVTLPPGDAAAWFSRIPTTQKVAFITIDDGWEKNPLALKLFQASNVPITLFLEVNAIKDNPDYFKPLQAAGATIEDHTISHPNLKGKSYAFQRREICGGADQLAQYYGRRPIFFRPPGGTHDATTLRVVKDCGMKAAFYWKETTDHGVVFYQEDKTVHPGDIILMHFRPRFVDDYLAVLNAIHKAGLTPACLEDYIP